MFARILALFNHPEQPDMSAILDAIDDLKAKVTDNTNAVQNIAAAVVRSAGTRAEIDAAAQAVVEATAQLKTNTDALVNNTPAA